MPLMTTEAAKSFEDLIRSLREFSSVGKATVKDAEELLSTVKVGIKSVDDALLSLKVTETKFGYLLMGDETVGLVDRVMREGNLPELIQICKKDIKYTSGDVRSFKQLASVKPEKALLDLDDLSKINKRKYPHLNATPADFDHMSNTAKKEVTEVESSLMKKFKNGAIISLTVGAVVVGVDWLYETTKKRQGCFMVTTINNRTTSCKVKEFTCVGVDSDLCTKRLDYTNTTLVLIYICGLPDDNDLKIQMAKLAGYENVSDVSNKLGTIIDTKFKEMSAFVKDLTSKQKIPTLNVCELKHTAVENGVVPVCRLCSSVDPPTSTTYIDPSFYPDNVSFKCITNPSMLDTISDVIKTTGVDILSIISSVSGALKPLFIALAVIVLIVICLALTLKFLPKLFANKQPANNA